MRLKNWLKSVILTTLLLALPQTDFSRASIAGASVLKTKKHVRTPGTPIFSTHSNPLGKEISADAIQLIDILGLHDKLQRLLEINALAGDTPSRLPVELRQERNDLHLEILDKVEETRLQIDLVTDEIDEEQVILEEGMRIFTEETDERVNRANLWAFRTNGVLWAVAEALTIPSYKSPKLSVPSGTVGIIAGIVPSVFSAYATRASDGGRFKRQIYPNMMTQLYDIPPIPRVEFPNVVWRWLNSSTSDDKRSRRQIILDHWRDDKNINVFHNGINHDKLMLLTGNENYNTNMQLISDKLIMMGQLKAVTRQMSRPLLEICMAAQGKKRFHGPTLDKGSTEKLN
jgi:hypothetical protein